MAATSSAQPSTGRIHSGKPVLANNCAAEPPKANFPDSTATTRPTHQRSIGTAILLSQLFVAAPSFAAGRRVRFNQTVARARIKIEPVKPLQVLDTLQIVFRERALPIESV